MKKGFSLVLCAAMLGAMFAGCQQNSSSSAASSSSNAAVSSSAVSEEATGVTYPIEGNVTLSMAIGEEAAVTTTCAFADTPFVKAWEEATGVTLEISHPSDFALLFASGDLPDIINYGFGSYTGGAAQAITDKIIYPINDLLDDYAPDLKNVLYSNEDYKKACTTSNGDVIGFPFIRGDKLLLSSSGIIIRQDWLDDLNLETPETADDLYNVLKAFKEQMGATAPFSCTNDFLQLMVLNEGMFTSPFDLPQTDYYQIDGTVHYGYYEQNYKNVLTYLNILYTEGLLDANFATIDSNTVNSNFMNGVTGVTVGALGGGIGNYLQTMATKDTNFNVSGISSLVAQKGDIPMSSYYDNPVTGSYAIITPSCKNKKAAAQFLNYGYTEEGHLLFNFGIQGESYTMENNVPTYTDLIKSNPNGLTMQQALAQYCRSWSGGSFVQDAEYIKQYAGRPQQQAALAAWSNSKASDYQIPPITIAPEDAAEYSRLSGDISTYIGEMRTKFISGLEPLSNFDTYLSTLKEMGVETLIEMQQKALDEFNAR